MMILSLRLARNILLGNTSNRLYVMKMGYVPLMLSQLGYALKVRFLPHRVVVYSLRDNQSWASLRLLQR